VSTGRVLAHTNSEHTNGSRCAYYAVGASQMRNAMFAGPNFSAVQCVELYVSSSDLGACFGQEFDGMPVCEHGLPKKNGACSECAKPLAGHCIIDHNPYLPCMEGHGTG